MRSRVFELPSITVLLAGVVLGGCQKSSETERREAERSAAEAQRDVSRATSEADKERSKAEYKAAEQHREMLTAVAREKAELTDKLHAELDRVAKALAELKFDPQTAAVKDGGYVFGDRTQREIDKIQKLLSKRDALRSDLDAMGRVPDHDWPTLKTRIHRDLDKEALPPMQRPPRI